MAKIRNNVVRIYLFQLCYDLVAIKLFRCIDPLVKNLKHCDHILESVKLNMALNLLLPMHKHCRLYCVIQQIHDMILCRKY